MRKRSPNKRGRPARLRPVDAPIDELDPDADEIIGARVTADEAARDLGLSAVSRMYADRRSLF